jgi:TonB family protein
MKILLNLLILIIFLSTCTIAQSNDNPIVNPEIMPQFPGGQNAMFEYLKLNIKYPSYEKENNISGKVYVYFVIDTTGRPVDAKIVVSRSRGIDQEALRVISEMPKWSIGMQGGKKVKVCFTIPINFTLKEPDNNGTKILGQILGGIIGFAGGYFLVTKLLN